MEEVQAVQACCFTFFEETEVDGFFTSIKRFEEEVVALLFRGWPMSSDNYLASYSIANP